MDSSLDDLFARMDEPGEVSPEFILPGPPEAAGTSQGELFSMSPNHPPESVLRPIGADPPALPREPASGFLASRLWALSANAYDAILHGWMSELPIEAELIRFGRKLLTAARLAGEEAENRSWAAVQLAERRAAEGVATDRGDPDARTVLEAAAKVRHEIHRLLGFLRFSPLSGPDKRGLYIARCAPDYCVLPALGPHFVRRFGKIPWGIIDEKRSLSLVRLPGTEPEIMRGDFSEPNQAFRTGPVPRDEPDSQNETWEDLWRLYHRTVTIENRKNPSLQRQFMPRRYWKYLPEMGDHKDNHS